jgi:hypothetical protein
MIFEFAPNGRWALAKQSRGLWRMYIALLWQFFGSKIDGLNSVFHRNAHRASFTSHVSIQFSVHIPTIYHHPPQKLVPEHMSELSLSSLYLLSYEPQFGVSRSHRMSPRLTSGSQFVVSREHHMSWSWLKEFPRSRSVSDMICYRFRDTSSRSQWFTNIFVDFTGNSLVCCSMPNIDLSLTITRFSPDYSFFKAQPSFSIQKSHVMKFTSRSRFGDTRSNHISGKSFDIPNDEISSDNIFVPLS